MDFYCVIGPAIRLLDAETAHGLAIKALRTGLVPPPPPFDDACLRTTVWGLDFPNPVGLGAGFDKNAEVPGPLLAQGFGFVEVGTVTPRPQPGNPKPRLFRLSADGGVINRMGFNNEGAAPMAARLKSPRTGLIGVNLGKNKDSEDAIADYVLGIETLGPLADYLVVNVSSPNTPGLRALQGREPLAALLAAAMAARDALPAGRRPPLLLKIAPDLTDEDREDIAQVVLDVGIDGLIATNTTIDRPPGLRDARRGEMGGLSGRPLFEPSTRVLSAMYRLTGGRLPLVGVGGVASGRDAYAKIRAGASLVQLYSALVYQGPGLVNRIKRDLSALLKADGFARVADAVGADHR
ncbi:MAG: quinone-dependent dihydroorotate dehydrogenase [Magnetospirillum sp. WYHS-4]